MRQIDKPVHIDFAVESVRLTTFNNWPASKEQRPEQLAAAGFFYKGPGDRVVCFYCDGFLIEWQPGEDPWSEHAYWFPHCSFVYLMKGDTFIRRAKKRLKSTEEHQVEAREVRAQMELPMGQAVPQVLKRRETERKKDLEEENRHLREQKLCKTCLDALVGVVFLPCGHLCCCPKCAPAVQQCPICRADIRGIVRTFFP